MVREGLGSRVIGRGVAVALALLTVVGGVRADIVHLVGGDIVEGTIVEEGDDVVMLDTDFGPVELSWDEIDRIERGDTPREELRQRRERLADDDAGGRFQLARWADDKGLVSEARELLEEVLVLDPDHGRAHKLLGRAYVDEAWLDPDELAAWLAEREPEQAEQGLHFMVDDEGRGAWVAEEVLRRSQGLELYDGEWLPRRQAHTLAVIDELAAIDLHVDALEGDTITLFTELPSDEAESILYELEAEVADFVRRFADEPADRERVLAHPIPIYVMPDFYFSETALEAGFMDRYPHLERLEAEWFERHAYGVHWPRPALVVVDSHHLDHTGRRSEGRRGLLAHMVASLLVERLKGERRAPPWVKTGLAAHYEGATNYYATLSIELFAELDEDGNPMADPWVNDWASMSEWRDRLQSEASYTKIRPLKVLMTWDAERFDSRDVGVCWSLVRFLMDRHHHEFVEYLRRYDPPWGEEGRGLRTLHEEAWADSFAQSLDDLQQEWKRWAMVRPAAFPPDELDRH